MRQRPSVCLPAGYSGGDGCVHRRRYLSGFTRCWFQEEGFCLHPIGTYSATSFPVHVPEGQHARWTPQGEPVAHSGFSCPAFVSAEAIFKFDHFSARVVHQ